MRFPLLICAFAYCFTPCDPFEVTRTRQHWLPHQNKRKSVTNLQASDAPLDGRRRELLTNSAVTLFVAGSFQVAKNNEWRPIQNVRRLASDDTWEGTSLPLLSLEAAYDYALTSDEFAFGHWPDPILRRPASRLNMRNSKMDVKTLQQKVQLIAKTLQNTAHAKGAVGLAAQQCGVDLSLVYLQTSKRKSQDDGIFLLNPRIVQRSLESEMKVWTEECLVLPPSFRATLLRDAVVTLEYETIHDFSTRQITLEGELARAVQHEMQHDEGILITDHVGLSELPAFMQEIEADGRQERMQQAFSRAVEPSTVATTAVSYRSSWQEYLVPSANAADEVVPTADCNEACLAERRRRIDERRAMMRQSRSNTNRQDVFELSRQRAALYNTTYQGALCPPGIPCL